MWAGSRGTMYCCMRNVPVSSGNISCHTHTHTHISLSLITKSYTWNIYDVCIHMMTQRNSITACVCKWWWNKNEVWERMSRACTCGVNAAISCSHHHSLVLHCGHLQQETKQDWCNQHMLRTACTQYTQHRLRGPHWHCYNIKQIISENTQYLCYVEPVLVLTYDLGEHLQATHTIIKHTLALRCVCARSTH